MLDCNCKDCKDRHDCCHDTCEKYKKAVEKWRATQQWLREQKRTDMFYRDHCGRARQWENKYRAKRREK